MQLKRSAVGCPRWIVAGSAVVVCAVSVAACGSSHHSTSSTSTVASSSAQSSAAAPAGSSTTPASSSGSSTIDNALAQRYIGGRPGKASGRPVYVGFANVQGGPVVSFPQATAAAQATVKYINDQLGGVHGRPLALKTCFIAASEEEGQACGEKFAADDSVPVVTYPLLTFGQQSLMTALQGKKPLISSLGQYTHPTNAYVLTSDLYGLVGGEIQYLLDVIKPKSVAMITQGDSPPDVQAAAVIKSSLERAGVTVRSATVEANAPNVSSTLVSAGAQSADALLLGVDSPSLCVGVAEALPQLGLSNKPLMGASECTDPSVAKATGDLLKGTYMYSSSSVLAPGLDPDVQLYEQVMKRYAPTVQANVGTGPEAFSVLMTVAKYLNATKSMTAAEISKEATDYHGHILMAEPKTDCGFTSSNPSLCSKYVRAYTYKGHGKWTAGAWFLQTAIPWSSDK